MFDAGAGPGVGFDATGDAGELVEGRLLVAADAAGDGAADVLLFEITLLTTASGTTATCVGLDIVPDELTDTVVGGAVVDSGADCVGC